MSLEGSRGVKVSSFRNIKAITKEQKVSTIFNTFCNSWRENLKSRILNFNFYILVFKQ